MRLFNNDIHLPFYKMPLEADDQARVDEAIRESGANPSDDRVLVRNTPDSQKLGPLTVMCTILNRTIGECSDSYPCKHVSRRN